MNMKKRMMRTLAVGIAAVALPGAASAAVAPNLYANVSLAGAQLGGNGVTGIAHAPGSGQYEVTFNRNVSGCAYLATTTNAFSQAIQAYTAGGHLGPNGVFVEIKNQGGGLMDGPFHLAVICDAPKTKFAVVGYAADLVRSSPGTTLGALGAGRYNVTFPINVKGCAFLATVADPNDDLVFNPSGVYTASGATANQVYVETKNPGGGLQDGVPFHVAAICPGALKTQLAVVKDSGLIVRGSKLTSSYRSANGKYAMVTPVNVSPDCATVATRGSIDKDVPFTPATVEILAGPAANAVGIDVRQLLFFGGAALNEEFHVASFCK
jgi:hypothetical protein